MRGRPPTDQRLRWFAVLLAAAFVVALPAIDSPYFDDDFQFVFESPSLNAAHYFTWHNPENTFYRPIQSAFLAAVQATRGMETWPVHVTQVALHAALAMLVFVALAGLGFCRRDAGLASVLFVVSQDAVMTVSSNDTFSQLLGVLSGYLAVWAFYRGARAHPGRPGLADRRYLAGLAWLAVSLFSKETSVAFILLGAFALMAGSLGPAGGTRRAGVIAARVAPLLLLLAVYLLARGAVASAAPEMGEGRYGISLGTNVVKNAVMLLLAATLPFSSVDMFTALSTGNRPALALFGLLYGVFAVLVIAGLWRLRGDRRVWRLAVAGVLSILPIIPANHVSELYSYQLLPVAAALIALGLGALGDVAATGGAWWRRVWVSVVAVVIASGALAAHEKAGMIDASARRADVLLDAVVPFARELPPGGELVLRNPDRDVAEYSVFRLAGFDYFRHADFYIARLAGRNDIAVRIVPAGDPAPEPGPGRTVLVLRDGRVEALAR